MFTITFGWQHIQNIMQRNVYSYLLVKILYHSGALCWAYCQYEAEVESNLPTLKTD